MAFLLCSTSLFLHSLVLTLAATSCCNFSKTFAILCSTLEGWYVSSDFGVYLWAYHSRYLWLCASEGGCCSVLLPCALRAAARFAISFYSLVLESQNYCGHGWPLSLTVLCLARESCWTIYIWMIGMTLLSLNSTPFCLVLTPLYLSRERLLLLFCSTWLSFMLSSLICVWSCPWGICPFCRGCIAPDG